MRAERVRGDGSRRRSQPSGWPSLPHGRRPTTTTADKTGAGCRAALHLPQLVAALPRDVLGGAAAWPDLNMPSSRNTF